jgi:disulfide bond formation protein DsbB
MGSPLLIIGDICVLLGLIGQRDNVTGLFAVPVALFEFSLGIYLIVKGFKSTIEDDENQPK